jgi:LPXTG-site transpeptidase (sortase) family protein
MSKPVGHQQRIAQHPAGRVNQPAWLWLERLSVFFGLVLLLTFAGFKYQQNESGDAGLEAFYQQVHAATLQDSVAEQPDPVAASTSSSPDVEQQAPDFELWSEIRVREYQESLLHDAETPLGVLQIDRLNIEVPIYNGTDEFVLNRGVGRIKGTARINAIGNLGIAGHRDGFFRPLKDIQIGDVLKLQTIHGELQYRVGSTVIVDPSDVSVLASTSEQTLTLVTCYPFYFVGHAPKRFIVQATAEPQIAMN